MSSMRRGSMQDVIVAVDPAKRSHTIEVLDHRERTLATLRIENTTAGYRELRTFVKKWPARRWAVEGAHRVGRQLAQRLISDGERVIDEPAKLSTRVRVLNTGHAWLRDRDLDTARRALAIIVRLEDPLPSKAAGPPRSCSISSCCAAISPACARPACGAERDGDDESGVVEPAVAEAADGPRGRGGALRRCTRGRRRADSPAAAAAALAGGALT
jgi:hypothetical protein